MIKTLLQITFGLLLSIDCAATANSVYHEFTMNTTGGGCGIYASKVTPINTDAVTLAFTIDYQFFTNRARIYYTTDGSSPAGAFGVPSGTTQVITAAYTCTFINGGGTVDVAKGTIPALPVGTVVKYIVSAWHSSGGLEIFASGGSNISSATATVFTYVVSSLLPVGIINFSAKKDLGGVQLAWKNAQEINTVRYEIYSSASGSDFKNIGSRKAAGNNGNATEYSFTDVNPANGKNFYRLKVIDNDGHFIFTPVISVSFNKALTIPVNVTGHVLHVRLDATQRGNYSVTVVNTSGQIMGSWIIRDNNGASDHLFELAGKVGPGIFHVAVKAYPFEPLNTSFTTPVYVQ